MSTTFTTSRGPVHAVRDVSLSLARHETLGIVGESGSGKSVLTRSIMGLLPATAQVAPESRVIFNGVDLLAAPAKQARALWGKEIAMIFQDPMTSLNPVRTIGVQLLDPLRKHLGMSTREAKERAADLLAQVGINEPRRRLDQFPHELSGGMRQRVMIAIAISCSPGLVIADEPTTALDVTVQRGVLDLLAKLQEEHGMAMILISHDLDVVAGRTDRTMVMYGGRVAEHSQTRELFRDTRHPYTAALIQATPRLDDPAHQRTPTIPGHPPDLRFLPAGCTFAPRCARSIGACEDGEPTLSPADGAASHTVACRNPLTPDQAPRTHETQETL